MMSLGFAGSSAAQGNIFGIVTASDLSTPPDDELVFFGFVNNTDNEIRLPACIGVGYESGNWYDNFQNFQGASAGMAYRYYFFDPAITEAAQLSGTIPTNSFQQEDIDLSAAAFPPQPTGLTASKAADDAVLLTWDNVTGTTWHVYRRTLPSAGSFFRIDAPSGSLANHGVPISSYSNTGLNPDAAYDYLVIAEGSGGVFSPPSDFVTINLHNCCTGLVGDVNGQSGDTPTIGDISKLIDHLFIAFTVPACLGEADVNQSGGANPTPADITIGDISLLIDHLFVTFRPIPYCDDVMQ
jgi:hypothetical protein